MNVMFAVRLTLNCFLKVVQESIEAVLKYTMQTYKIIVFLSNRKLGVHNEVDDTLQLEQWYILYSHFIELEDTNNFAGAQLISASPH